MDKIRVVLASGNKGKISELQHRLGQRYELVSQSDLGVAAPEETGLTFIENALLKARAASEQTGLPTIADDSGLSVDALGGAPGIYSARFAGESATDEQNNALLIERLAALPNEARTAHFQCALVYMRHDKDPTPIVCQGTWHGQILTEPRGNNGFGYDPLFYSLENRCSSAELPADVKNQVSHRGRAVDKLIAELDSNA